MSEAQLIQSACDGDGRAVRALYERYAPRVYAVVRRIAGDDELARDYAQEAWIRAIRALPTFRGEARFSTGPSSSAVTRPSPPGCTGSR